MQLALRRFENERYGEIGVADFAVAVNFAPRK